MSLRQKSFQAELESELLAVGLPTDLHQIIGRLYRFRCEHGSHDHTLVGTVQAVEISDEGGLDLYVSNPRFWGKRLISIKHSNGRWMVYVDIKPRRWSDEELRRMSEEENDHIIKESIAARFFEGEFQLL